MAEFCLDCYNRLNNTNLKKRDVKLSVDVCERCGQVKPTIDYIVRTDKIKPPCRSTGVSRS